MNYYAIIKCYYINIYNKNIIINYINLSNKVFHFIKKYFKIINYYATTNNLNDLSFLNC